LNGLRFADRLPDRLPEDPMHLANTWLKEALANAGARNSNSMTLATAGHDGQPSARVVLCKLFVPDPGYVVFYTNYRSRKGRELAANPSVAATFYWDNLGLQIRLEGLAVRSPESESDSYFLTRDRGSQLGAWGSDQSEAIASHDALVLQIRERAAQLGVPVGDDERGQALADAAPAIPRPPHWGGVRIWVSAVELWVEGKDRIHDRALWRRELIQEDEHTFSASSWTGTRLQP
jgi:pyridoxamine 5'-phosphate oxidase